MAKLSMNECCIVEEGNHNYHILDRFLLGQLAVKSKTTKPPTTLYTTIVKNGLSRSGNTGTHTLSLKCFDLLIQSLIISHFQVFLNLNVKIPKKGDYRRLQAISHDYKKSKSVCVKISSYSVKNGGILLNA